MAPSRRTGKKWRPRRPGSANDNPRRPAGAAPRFDVYRTAAQARRVGRVIASTDEAVKLAAVEFDTVKKLIAVRRFEIA
jgi:hypothetical protein